MPPVTDVQQCLLHVGFLPENAGVIFPPVVWIFLLLQGLFWAQGCGSQFSLGGFRSIGTQLFVFLPKKQKG